MDIRGVNNRRIGEKPGIRSVRGKSQHIKLPSDSVEISGKKESSSDPVRIKILHMNDMHGVVEPKHDPEVSKDIETGGFASAKTAIDREKSKDPEGTITLNAGDFAEGTMVSYLSRGKVATEAMGKMGFDACTLGNHDFNWGQDALREMMNDLNAPVVLANITNEDGSSMEGTCSHIMKNVKGINVAVIGVDTPDVPDYVDEKKVEGLKFESAAEALNKHMPQVRKEGADLIVVLSHLGFDRDVELAQEVKGIDVIVGGHSHTKTEKPHKEGDTIIVQAGAMGEQLGSLEIDVDPSSKRIVGAESKLIQITSRDYAPDPEIQKILEPYIAGAKQTGSRVIGKTEEEIPFSHTRAEKLDQMLGDSILKASGADVCIYHARCLRAPLKKGDVTYENLFSAMPFTEETFVTCKTTGKMILAEMEDDLKDGANQLAVPSGFKYEVDQSRPFGDRVVSATMPDGTSLDPEKEYTVAMNVTISRKKFFRNSKDKKVMGNMQETFLDYIENGSPWKNDPDDRVKFRE
ncbi:MAG: bifunctional metallophosphatase/5'-nucleotidase [Candidatus Eremiobacteraeota bacterium]|nr:bifunctional metallophosphatase/5'-nucleotidase [Candidatus Eremiobacteraeota bacterium]